MSVERTTDVWDGEWDAFQNACVDLAILWTRMFDDNMYAFAAERVIESIRQGGALNPSRPWSDFVPTASIRSNNPFLRALKTKQIITHAEEKYTTGIKKTSYILIHPCLILMNIYHSYKALSLNYTDWEFMEDKIERLFRQYTDDINEYREGMSFEIKLKNPQTNRYTDIRYTRPFFNTQLRIEEMLKRYKKYNSTEESILIQVHRHKDLLCNPIQMTDIGPAIIPSLEHNLAPIQQDEEGVFSPYQVEIDHIRSLEIKKPHEWKSGDSVRY